MTPEHNPPMRGVLYALGAAFLFGGSTPVAKMIVGRGNPVLIAGLLYLSSGVLLIVWKSVVRLVRAKPGAEARPGRGDLRWLASAVLFGGVLGPILLMYGLVSTPGSTASLLLNLEGVLTALLAWFVFREPFDRRIALGMVAITAGGVLASWDGGLEGGVPWGPMAIAGACLAWAIDNNLTRKVSAGDPIQIAAVKGCVAGSVNLCIAFVAGAVMPSSATVAACGVVGLFGYGLSLVLFVMALRELGTARTGAYFSIAPFVGAAVAMPLLGETPTALLLAAAILMAIGIWLHLTERHYHEHDHEEMIHEHSHVHDEHHRHEHTADDPPGEPHSHSHRHVAMRHSHPHYPDIHHRHPH